MSHQYQYDHGHRYRLPRRKSGAETLAEGLGWFSIALGAAELLAPRALGRALGMEDQAALIRAYGVRKLAIGILSQDDPTPWMWARVAGDALDLATPSAGLHHRNMRR